MVFFISCSDNPEVIESLEDEPAFIFNCNLVNDSNESLVYINLQVLSKEDKLFNGSIKGQGLANDFYKDLEDVNKNTSYEAEYIFKSSKNGDYTFLLFFENSNNIYTEQCNGSITSITTTTTTKPTTTTTTTTTTKAKILPPSVSIVECPKEVSLPSDFKIVFTVTAKSYSVAEVISYVEDSTFEYDPTIWDTFPSVNEKITYTQNWSFNKDTYSKDTTFLYRIEVVDKNGLKASQECLIQTIGPYETTTTTQMYNYDEDKFRLTNFIDDYGEVIEGSPFICEKTTDGAWGRCVSYEKWKLDPGMEKADSQWILHCSNGKSFTTATWLCNG